MGYKKFEQGADTIFEVTPEDAPPQGFLAAAPFVQGCLSVVVGMIVLFAMAGLFGVPGAVVFAGGLVLFLWGRTRQGELGKPSWAMRIGALLLLGPFGLLFWFGGAPKRENLATKDRVPARFTVNPDGILLNGQTFKRADIHRIANRNAVLEAMGGNVVLVNDGSFSSRNYAAGARMAHAYHAQLAQVSYRVEMESGGLPHVLAGGLTEAGAFAILSDVSAILHL